MVALMVCLFPTAFLDCFLFLHSVTMMLDAVTLARLHPVKRIMWLLCFQISKSVDAHHIVPSFITILSIMNMVPLLQQHCVSFTALTFMHLAKHCLE